MSRDSNEDLVDIEISVYIREIYTIVWTVWNWATIEPLMLIVNECMWSLDEEESSRVSHIIVIKDCGVPTRTHILSLCMGITVGFSSLIPLPVGIGAAVSSSDSPLG